MNNIYFYKNKDVTLLFVMKITDVCEYISDATGIKFKHVLASYYASKTYEIMKNTDNGLWLEPAGYIANQYLEEKNYN